MADPYVREVGRVTDGYLSGSWAVGVDYDTVKAGPMQFTLSEAEEFAQLFVRACWEAGRNARQMAEEAAVPP